MEWNSPQIIVSLWGWLHFMQPHNLFQTFKPTNNTHILIQNSHLNKCWQCVCIAICLNCLTETRTQLEYRLSKNIVITVLYSADAFNSLTKHRMIVRFTCDVHNQSIWHQQKNTHTHAHTMHACMHSLFCLYFARAHVSVWTNGYIHADVHVRACVCKYIHSIRRLCRSLSLSRDRWLSVFIEFYVRVIRRTAALPTEHARAMVGSLSPTLQTTHRNAREPNTLPHTQTHTRNAKCCLYVSLSLTQRYRLPWAHCGETTVWCCCCFDGPVVWMRCPYCPCVCVCVCAKRAKEKHMRPSTRLIRTERCTHARIE